MIGLFFFLKHAQQLHHNVIMYYLLCCAGEPLKDFPEWTVESFFLSSAIAYLCVSSCALLISALKSIENCQSGEISFGVRGPNE